ncbi:MAG: AI-2E family transporter [Candidatus Acidiferrales bacterium]
MAVRSAVQKRLGALLFYGIIILLVFGVYLVFASFLVPLAWAAVLVVVSYPVYERLARRRGSTVAAAVMTAAVTLILIVPVILIMIAFVRQGFGAAQSIRLQLSSGHWAWLNDHWTRVQQRFPETNLQDLTATLRQYGEQAAGFVAARLGTIVRHTAEFLFHLGVTILAIFYLFRDGGSMVARLREILPFESSHRDRMLTNARDLIFASVISSLAAAAAHAILGGLAFAAAGISAPIFWGVMMGFFSFVPIVGSALIWVPVAISLIAGGHTVKGILLVIFCVVIVGLVDNFIRPWLISGRTEMGGLVVFISVLGGISVFGLLGVVLGPIIVATAVSFLDLYAPPAHIGNNAAHASGN